MEINIQQVIENDKAILLPLQATDFAALYAAASDPAVWEQHPNKDRWKEEVFRVFFEGAMESKVAFKIVDKATGEVAGSTRFYDCSPKDSSIFIGYTFYATRYWGTGINRSVKKDMLDYIFRHVSTVFFHIGASNIRSQMAIGRVGAAKVGEQTVTYFGEAPKLNFIYRITREEWLNRDVKE
jgi:RimJ/RimL family protein N-acetyltransferase